MPTLAQASDRVHLWSPVLVKELRTRMRGSRPVWLQAGYVFIMLLVMGGTYAAEVGTTGTVASTLGFRLGRAMFQGLFIVQAVLVALIVPGLTAGAISGEQEQRTYELLAATRLRSRQVVLGKLLSAWLFAALLLTTSLPLAALCLLFGGVSPAELMWSYAIVALCALLLAAIGLWWSTVFSRSILAVMGAYATMGAFLIASAVLMIDPFASVAAYMPTPSVFAAVNPFGAIYYAANPVAVYGWSIPAGVAAVAILVLAAGLVAGAASQRLPLLGRRSGIFVRGLMVVLFGVGIFLAMGNYGQDLRMLTSARAARCGIAIAACGLIAALTIIAPIIAAGEMDRPPRGRFLQWVLGGLSPRRILQPQVRSAFPFLLVLGVVGCGVIGASLLYFSPLHRAAWWPLMWRMAMLTLASAFGCSMLGLWAAVAWPGTRGRVVLGVGLLMVYLLTLLIIATAPPGPALLSVQTAYLNPALIALSYFKPTLYSALSTLHGGAGLGIAATSAALFVLFGVIGFLGANAAFKRQATSSALTVGATERDVASAAERHEAVSSRAPESSDE